MNELLLVKLRGKDDQRSHYFDVLFAYSGWIHHCVFCLTQSRIVLVIELFYALQRLKAIQDRHVDVEDKESDWPLHTILIGWLDLNQMFLDEFDNILTIICSSENVG